MKLFTTILLAAFAVTAMGCGPQTTDSQRDQMISWLGEYRDAGQFPVNRGDEPKAIFIDQDGRLCAVAFLMTQSGYGDLVKDIAATDNHALIRDLLTRDDVAAWVQTSGLTIDELANIQEPAYIPTGEYPADDPALVAAVDEDRARIQKKLTDVQKRLQKVKKATKKSKKS